MAFFSQYCPNLLQRNRRFLGKRWSGLLYWLGFWGFSLGPLTGYAAGLDVKRRLLELEGVRLEQGPRGWYTA